VSKRVLIATFLGAVVMYLWIFIAHMALPLGEAGIKQIDNEEPLLAAMKSTLHDPGMYMFPRMAPGDSEAAYQKKMATGPSGILVYFPTREFQFGKSLAIEFVTELMVVAIGMYLLTLTRIGTFAGRCGFFALFGLALATATNVSYWNWYGYPSTYTLAYSFTGWAGCVFAGLIAGAMKIGGKDAA
jgi:hypothetical protein